MSTINLKAILEKIEKHERFNSDSPSFFQNMIHQSKEELSKLKESHPEYSIDIANAFKFIGITEREDLDSIRRYPKSKSQLLRKVQETLISNLFFVKNIS